MSFVCVALVFLVLGYIGGRYVPLGMADGYFMVRFYGDAVEDEPVHYVFHVDGIADDDVWLPDQLRQIADQIEGIKRDKRSDTEA